MKIMNTCRINYEYQEIANGPIFKETIYSNRVETIILDERITVMKTVDKLVVSVFEIMTYTFQIKNISEFLLQNIYFIDVLQPNIQFIHNSVLINGKKRRSLNPNNGFYLNALAVGETIDVSFEVTVKPESVHSSIPNHVNVDYDHVYHIHKDPVIVEVSSNEVTSVVENRLFKQWTHYSEFEYPELKLTNETFKLHSAKISVITPKLIQSDNNYQLLIIAKITYKFIYENCHTEHQYTLYESEGISTLVTVSEGIKYCYKLGVKAEIEDCELQILNHHHIAINTQLLFNVY